MEYPGIVFISINYFDGAIANIGKVIVHETVHQWFYGIIGNDEIEEGWIDEGMTSYMTSWYDLNYVDKNTYSADMKNYKSKLDQVGGKDKVIMIKSAADYSDWSEYGIAAYTKSLLMFSDLYDEYGEEKFIEFLQTLYNEYKFKIVKQDDIVNVANAVFNEDLSGFFETWLK
jgi:aminopeptidase N